MKYHLFILKPMIWVLIVLLSSFNSFSQSSENTKNNWWIGGSFNLFIPYGDATIKSVPILSNATYNFKVEDVNLVNLGLGVKKVNKNDWYQEYTLSSLSFQKDEDFTHVQNPDPNIYEPYVGQKKTSIYLLLGLEYGKFFRFHNIKNLAVGLGLSLNPFFDLTRVDFRTSIGFPFTYGRIGAEIQVIPRIEYQVSNKLSLVLKMPLVIDKIFHENLKMENPFLPSNQSNSSNLLNQFGLHRFQSSLGVSYKISAD